MIAWFVLAACDELEGASRDLFEPAAEVPEASPQFEVDGPLAVALAVTWPEVVPERFAVALPRSYEGLEAWQNSPHRAPTSAIHAGLCRGDPAWRSAWEEAVVDAAGSGMGVYDLQPWTQLAVGCRTAERCAWVRSHLVGDAPAAGTPAGTERGVYLTLLSECRTDVDAAVVESSAASDDAAFGWFSSQWSGAWRGTSPRMEALLAAAVARDDVPSVRALAIVVAGLDRDRALAVLLGLRDRARSDEVRDELAAALGRSSDPRAIGLVDELCGRAGWRVDLSGAPLYPICGLRGQATFFNEPDPRHAIDDWVRGWDAEPQTYVQTHPDERAVVVDALVRCVLDEGRSAASTAPQGDEAFVAKTCLARLADVDRAQAVALAPAAAEIGPWVASLADALVRFPTADALELHLRQIGLAPGAATAPEKRPVEAVDVLFAQGRVYRLYTDDPGGWPMDAAVLLWNLAPLADGPLDDVVFDAIPAEYDPTTGEPTRPAVLKAWARGRAYRFDADEPGESYDVRASCGLLNAILEDVGSPLRYARLLDGNVVVGNGGSLKLAVAEGLLSLQAGDAPSSEY